MTHSTSILIEQLKQGDEDAVARLWSRYFTRLVPLAEKKLKGYHRVADGEDVVVSVFKSFCERIQKNQYDRLTTGNDLWRLLATITVHKAIDERRKQTTAKVGGGRVIAAVDLDDSVDALLDWFEGPGGPPDAAAAFAEEMDQLLSVLDNDVHRTIAVMRLQGYTVPEIAVQLDCVPRTVERKLALIRSAWLDHWQDAGVKDKA